MPHVEPHVSLAVTRGDQRGWLTMFACGRIAFMVYAFGDDAHAWQQRALSSMTCESGPGDAEKVDLPLVIGIPDGWHGAMSGANGLVLTDGRDMVLATTAPLLSDPKTIELFLGTLAATTGAFTAEGTSTDGDHRVLRGTAARSDGRAAVRAVAWPCPDAGLTIAIVALVPPGGDLGAMDARLHAARCTKPGEAATSFAR